MPEITDPGLLQQLNAGSVGGAPAATPATAGGGGQPAPPEGGDERFDEMSVAKQIMESIGNIAIGVGQGLIDPLEGLGQLGEHVTGTKLAPEAVRSMLRDYRTRATSTKSGQVGRVLGNVAPAVLGGPVTGILREAPLLAGLPVRMASGAIAAGAQPVEGGGDYKHTKLNQLALGAGTAGLLPFATRAAAMAPAAAVRGVMESVGLPKSLTHLVSPTHTGLYDLAVRAGERLPARAVGRAVGEVRGQFPSELRHTSEGLPYYQAPPEKPSAPREPSTTSDAGERTRRWQAGTRAATELQERSAGRTDNGQTSNP